jgi:drug/metabolite transporter (DMT)-like permease
MWGTADYLGGLTARRAPALTVGMYAQAVGLVAAWGLVAATGDWLSGTSAAWALVAGGVGALALALFYAALAAGAMTIVAPLSACGAVIPVTVALVGGESPGTLGAAGMALALGGAVLASLGADADHPTRLSARALGLSAGAAVGIGVTVALLQQAEEGGEAIAVVAVMRSIGTPTLLAAVLLAGVSRGLSRPLWPAVVAVGVFDAAANVTFVAASGEGHDAVVAVLGSLYPLTTVALAGILLRERPHRVQVAGVMVALAGIALIAAR